LLSKVVTMDIDGDWESLSDRAENLFYNLEDTCQISSSYYRKQIRKWLFDYDKIKIEYINKKRPLPSRGVTYGPRWTQEIAEQKS